MEGCTISRAERVDAFLATQKCNYVSWRPRVGRACYVRERSYRQGEQADACVILQDAPTPTKARRWRRARARGRPYPYVQIVSKGALRDALLACDAGDWAEGVRQMFVLANGGIGAKSARDRGVWARMATSAIPIFGPREVAIDVEMLRLCAAEWNRLVDSFLDCCGAA